MANSEPTIKTLKAQLKWKAKVSEDKLRVKSGGKVLTVPASVRILDLGDYVYLSVPVVTGLYKKDGKTLVEQPDGAMVSPELQKALDGLKKGKRKAKATREPAAEMPAELLEALRAIPKGQKVVLKGDGYAIVKARSKAKA